MAGRPEKFGSLRNYLSEKAREFHDSGDDCLAMTFKEIEALGVPLPPSAYNYRAWWANYYKHNYIPQNFHQNSKAKPWERAKFRTEDVNLKTQTLKFRYGGDFSAKGIARQLAKQTALDRAELQRLKESKRNPLSAFERMNRQRIDALEKKLKMPAAADSTSGMADVSRPYEPPKEVAPNAVPRCRHPIYGALKGNIRLVAGIDLTEPADPEWGKRVWGDDDEDKK